MEIIWYGQSCFRLSERGQAIIVTDPYDGSIGLPSLKVRGDVVTISHDSPSHNNVAAVSGSRHSLKGPGEYEIGGVFITGIATNEQADQTENVLFLFDYGYVTIAHLGDMAKVPSQTKIEALEQVDVLLVPVGGGKSLNAAQAAELISMLEPGIVIPMHYHIPGLDHGLEDVERFLKEMGVTRPEEETSFKISSSSLSDETQVILLTPRIKM
ncbi:MAG TPA: MBL fold metallo-hydrolase [Patescibacteria group bacterium]|nr:MBL fold metallo-hydrolase [Patescibacteria group bacterium]